MSLTTPLHPAALAHLDPSTTRGRIYEQLVERPGASVTVLADAADTDKTTIRRHLSEMETLGLVMCIRSGPRATWEALQPASAIRSELAAREADLVAIRERVQRLSDLHWHIRQSGAQAPAVEVLHTQGHVLEHFLRLQRDARYHVRALDRPPYLGPQHPTWTQQQIAVQTQRMEAGVKYRAVYQRSVWDTAELADATHTNITNGEEARELARLPMKLTIMDDDRALISLEPFGRESDPTTLLVHRSALLDALVEIFETYWRTASPIGGTNRGLTDRQVDILRMLADGKTDDVIGRALGVSLRTVTRSITELNRRLGATTRFQAGLNAASRGYL